jgi:drug/metabolite transporter (DMT)-like permease
MFQIPLALLLTLESIGPLYSLPLSLLIDRECPSFRTSVGAVLAVTGIALLSLQGKLD